MKRLSPNRNHALRLVAILLLTGAILITGCMVQAAQAPAGSQVEGGEGQTPTATIIQVEEIVIALLLLAAVISILTERWRIPYTVGLVLAGLALAFIGSIPTVVVTPEIILALLVPPLVFEAAFHLNFSDLRRELPLVLALAVPGVILTTLMVGGLVSFGAGIPLPYALVFGALIAATDPVAVVALFRRLGAPKRLQVLLEGESLLNDGTAIVIFNMMLALAVSGHFNLGESILEFLIVAGGGLLVGAVAGIIVSQLIGRIDNYLVETTLTTILAYGSYLVAEYFLGVSGVLAVVTAGLLSGYLGPRGMSPTTRIIVFNFWEYVAFLANSFVFLIIGLEIDLPLLRDNALAILWGIAAVLTARAVTIFTMSWLSKKLPFRWKNVLFWGGMRGAISLALTLSLAVNLPYRSQLQGMAFGVVLFTLVVQGLSMRPLLVRSGMVATDAAKLDFERRHARSIAIRTSSARLHQLNREGLISDYTWTRLRPLLERQYEKLTAEVHRALEAQPRLYQEEMNDAWRENLRTQRSTLAGLFRDGIISEDTYTELVTEVDVLLDNLESSWDGLAPAADETDLPLG
jgi:CPA1 family monovalent cation:H+ antiporter